MCSICGGRFARLLWLEILILSSFVGPALAAPETPVETFGMTLPARPKTVQPSPRPPSLRLGVSTAHAPQVALPPLDNALLEQREEEREKDETSGGFSMKMLQYAVPRQLAVAAVDGAWTALPDGRRLWAVELVSPNALGLRLHFAATVLPPGSELAVYAPTASAEIPRTEVRFSARAEQQRREFWTGTFAGERVRVEYLTAAGAEEAELPFGIDRLLHVYRDLVQERWDMKHAGSCNNDVSCYDELATVKEAVALVLMPNGACTGTLLDDLAHDASPFFLTANHCLYRQADAADTEFVWFYETAGCGGKAPSLATLPRSLGASIVSTQEPSDYSLLLIKGELPPGVAWAGWTSAEPDAGTEALTIHHPDGDFKRVSFGSKDVEARLCQRGFPGRKLVRIDWSDGPTEPGSSGAGIFRRDTLQLFGQLMGGPSACGHETYDCFGSFATTFARAGSDLVSGPDDASEDNDTCERARLVRPGTLSDRIVKQDDDDWYRVVVPAGKTLTVHLDYLRDDGAIELQGTTSCRSTALMTGSSDGNADDLVVPTVPGRRRATIVYWHVSLASSGTRNSYTMTVEMK